MDGLPPLVSIPYLGGGSALFGPWRRLESRGFNVAVLRLPGREARTAENPIAEFSELLGALEQHVVAALPDGPFAVFGYCSGSIIAFELAHLVATRGLSPLGLFAWDCDAPHLYRVPEAMSALPSQDFRARVASFGGMDSQIVESDELMEHVEPVLRADAALFESYTCAAREPLDVPFSVAGVRDGAGASLPSLLAWSAQTAAGFTLRLGGHGHFLDDAGMGNLARWIARDLAALMEG